MYRILIVEDTPSEADLLKACLSRYADERSTDFSVTVLPSALEFVNARHPADLVLMDIDMPGINGMEAAEIFRTYDTETPLIFVTNLAQYAVRGYSVDALDFVVKPVRYPDFSMRLDRAMRVLARNEGHVLSVPTADGLRRIAASSVVYIDLDKHDVQYHLEDGGCLKTRGSLRAVMEELGQGTFARISSGCLINMQRVARIGSDSVTMSDGSELFFSRRERKAALEALANFMGRSI